MGQKVHPIGFRLGVYRDWDAHWVARRSKYGQYLLEDIKIRRFLEKHFEHAEVARIEIDKTSNSLRVVIYSARPGLLIGKKGQEIEVLRKELSSWLNKPNVEVSVQEIKKPDLDATLVAKSIASQLEKRASFKRVMRRAALTAMKSGAKGIKICCSGRLNGAEIARTEWIRVGSTPLHTLRADIDYGFQEAETTFGQIGVKVWICRGEYQHAG